MLRARSLPRLTLGSLVLVAAIGLARFATAAPENPAPADTAVASPPSLAIGFS